MAARKPPVPAGRSHGRRSGHAAPARHRKGPGSQVPRQTAVVPCPLQLKRLLAHPPQFGCNLPRPQSFTSFFPSSLFLCSRTLRVARWTLLPWPSDRCLPQPAFFPSYRSFIGINYLVQTTGALARSSSTLRRDHHHPPGQAALSLSLSCVRRRPSCIFSTLA